MNSYHSVFIPDYRLYPRIPARAFFIRGAGFFLFDDDDEVLVPGRSGRRGASDAMLTRLPIGFGCLSI